VASFRALSVTAHPDDAEFGCAGTLAKWVDQGAEVTMCIVTDGSTGTQDRSLVGEGLASVRRAETEKAAAVIGAKEVVWLGYRDGYVEYSLGLRRDIARVFRAVRPHRYVVMDSAATIEDWFINHPDHKAVGHASLEVTLSAGTTPGHFPELLDEGLEPWRGLREVWMMGPGARPTAVDIAATIDRKIDALLCHASQIGEPERVGQWLREWTAAAGKPHGYGHAETFTVFSRGPGFHEGETDDVELDLTEPPVDPRA
jgi:LmbE family N-acetylglucosaminyl deacetylase